MTPSVPASAERSPEGLLPRARVLSTFENWADMPFWAAQVDSVSLTRVGPKGALASRFRILTEIVAGFRLWWASRAYDAVITDSRPSASVFGLLQRLPQRRRCRHLILECLWEHPGGRLRRLMKALQFRAAVSPFTRAVVYASREREAFSRLFGIPIGRFVFIPYHTTIYWDAPEATPKQGKEPYIFAGGQSQRDYTTLLEAAEGLGVRLVIAVRDRGLFAGRLLPDGVEVVTTNHTGFLQYMREATINVVPLTAGTLRSAGQQSFLNAMAFGTVTIVTDPQGAGDYIRNWETGILVPAGDSVGLREAIARVLRDSRLRARIRKAAREASDGYGTERILNLYTDFLRSSDFSDPTCTAYVGRYATAPNEQPPLRNSSPPVIERQPR